ncbi:hypothetical protein GCM10023165_34390 [Variovorax defluvii]|uniref:DUF3718 domain-containing protein n=1 Tax=Variovorax defluvii TaxID=913761 RepID=A0ABP8I095_9BURK
MATKQLRGAAAAALVLIAASPTSAQTPRPHLASVGVEELKRIYLQCDRVASRTLLDMATAAHCSMVSEELQHRVFGGDFDGLVAWWRTQKAKPAEAPPEALMGDNEYQTP